MGFENTNLELKVDDFSHNPDLRLQFKLILNSMLGKLAQKPSNEETTIVNSNEQLQEILKKSEVTNINCVNEDFCEVRYKQEGKKAAIDKKGNCIAYAFITARTRIYLHSNLMLLHRRGFKLYYTDCDSIIFSGNQKQRDLPLPLGIAFGDFKAELGENVDIHDFSCLGRKQLQIQYAKRTQSVPSLQFLYKIKGLSLDSKQAQEQVKEHFPTAETTKQAFQSDLKIPVPQIRRINNKTTKQTFCLSTRSACQRKVVVDDQNLYTIPWGYIDNK